MIKKLRALEGTEYSVTVVQQADTDYLVKVFRPLRTGERAMFHSVLGHVPMGLEMVGERYLKSYATERDLDRVVFEEIQKDQPSLVGTYAATEGE